MTYAELKTKLLADITDFLDNGFKQKLVKAVEERILPELQSLVMELHQKALEARDGTCVHYRDMLQKDIDRKVAGVADRVGTLEMYMPQIRMLGETVKDLQQDHELQRVATAKLETTTEHLEKIAENLEGKVDDQADEIDSLQVKPGEKALNSREKLKWLLIGGGISLGVMVAGGVLLAIFL